MLKLSLTILAALFSASAFAADMPIKSPFLAPIPANGCGYYVGLNTMGAAGAINGSTIPGASVIQGEIGGTFGYSCANARNGTFWFAEGLFDATNINGDNSGLSLSGPVDLFQRVGFGSPLATMLNLFPTLGSISVPSLPLLPSGVTAGPAAPYLYAGLHEQDISARFNLGSNREWLIAPEIGVGMRYRLSNAVVADVFAGWQMASKGVCVGGMGCPGLGNAARVGFQLEY